MRVLNSAKLRVGGVPEDAGDLAASEAAIYVETKSRLAVVSVVIGRTKVRASARRRVTSVAVALT